jgi:hypothetical protein
MLISHMFRSSRGHLHAGIWNIIGNIQIMRRSEISLLTGFCYKPIIIIIIIIIIENTILFLQIICPVQTKFLIVESIQLLTEKP